jgi:lipid-A-disaccharide synthase
MKSSRSLMFIVGEASADAHAAALIRALRTQSPDVRLFGAGGPKMRDAGIDLTLDLTEHAVVGLVEVLKNYGKFRRIFWNLVREAERRKPDAVVLVDFPGFNLRFAAQMKKRGFEGDVDLMLTIFPFEKDWYARHAPRLRVEFVGHPFTERFVEGKVESGERKVEQAGANSQFAIRNSQLILLLPGSREREVAKIWPILARVVDAMPADVKFVAAAVNDQMAAMIRHPRVQVEVGTAHDWMRRATLAITASGTATMECALYGCPMIVVYKVNWLTYLVGRMVVTVNWLAMPNVIAGRAIVPEFIQGDAQPDRVAAVARELLETPPMREAMQKELAAVVASLGGPGASARAARLVLEFLAAKAESDETPPSSAATTKHTKSS